MEQEKLEPDGSSSSESSEDSGDAVQQWLGTVMQANQGALLPANHPQHGNTGCAEGRDMIAIPGGSLMPTEPGELTPYHPATIAPQAVDYTLAGGTYDKVNIGGTHNVEHRHNIERQQNVQQQQNIQHQQNIQYVTNIMQPSAVQRQVAFAPSPTSPRERIPSEQQHEAEPGTIHLSGRIIMFEKDPINRQSRIFRGKLCNKITGDIDIVIKILPDGERERREARLHFLVPAHEQIVHRFLTDVFMYRGLYSIFMAMELCDRFNLHLFIRDEKKHYVPFNFVLYFSFAKQIVLGMDFLHRHGVMHRDLKPHNLLLAENRTVVKISDFGLSKHVTSDQTSATQSMIQPGTDGWKSPEVLMNAERISTSADIFSLALVIYHTLSYGDHPFGNDPHSWNHYIKRNENLDLTGLMVPNMGQAIQLLTSMLDPDPTKRPKAEGVLDHPFFKGTPPIAATRDQVNQLAHQTYMSLTRGKMPAIAQPHVEALLPGVRETSAQLSENMSRLINEGPFELKQKVPGMPPIRGNREQVTQLTKQTYMSLARERMPRMKQAQQGGALLPGVQETSVQLSEDMSQLINEGPLELKPKVQGTPPVQATREQISQLAQQTYTSLTSGRIPGSAQAQQGALLPGVQETSAQLSEDMSRLINEGPLELKQKVQGTKDQGSMKSTREQKPQFSEAFKKLDLGENVPSTSQASRTSPRKPDTTAEPARARTNQPRANHRQITPTLLPVYNAICCFDRESESLQAYDPAEKKWITKQKLHEDMMERNFTAAAVNDVIYVLMSNKQVYRLTQSDAGSKWMPIAPMMFSHGAWPPVVILYDTIYVIGTCVGSLISKGERYDSERDKWIRITDMKTMKEDHTLAATKGHIYCIGGWDGDQELASVERLNPGDQSWSDVSPMKTARFNAASAVLESKIFVLGGWNSGGRLSDVECYDPDTNTWTPVVNMRIGRDLFSAVVVDGKIFAVGGDDRSHDAKTIEMFDPEKKRWEVVEQVGNMEIHSLGAVAIKMQLRFYGLTVQPPSTNAAQEPDLPLS